jgi:hypothetical protein
MKHKKHHDASHMLPNAIFWEARFRKTLSKSLILMARPESVWNTASVPVANSLQAISAT